MKSHIIAILICILAINLYLLPKKDEVSNEPLIHPKPINVEIKGEVTYPGIYTFYKPITLNEVINYAGGLLEDADEINLNLNETFYDKQTIIINNKTSNNDEFKIIYNLNEISFEELKLIDNITENRAANIIIYRTQNGRFNSVEELLNVKNIGPVTYENIKDNFKV